MTNTCKVVLWNLEWATPYSKRGQAISSKICEHRPDIVCLCETTSDFLCNRGGYTICSEPRELFVGYPRLRKVLLWSHRPWQEVDETGQGQLTDGRFIQGITTTPLGELNAMGVCIPWSMSHVKYGRRDCKVWEDHKAYLQKLTPLLRMQTQSPFIVLGDFNQQFPRKRVPKAVHNLMLDTFSTLHISTTDVMSGEGKKAIDHLAHTKELVTTDIQIIERFDGSLRLSDHFGLAVSLACK